MRLRTSAEIKKRTHSLRPPLYAEAPFWRQTCQDVERRGRLAVHNELTAEIDARGDAIGIAGQNVAQPVYRLFLVAAQSKEDS